MKKLFLLLIPVVMSTGLSFRSAAQTATGSIEGTVTNSLTKLPIPGVQVSFRNLSEPQALPANVEVTVPANAEARQALLSELNLVLAGTFQQPTVLTDQSGRFVISGLSPGIYNLTAQLEGYYGPDINGTSYPSSSRNINVEKAKAS